MQNKVVVKKLCNFLITDAEANLSLATKTAEATGLDFQEKSTELVLGKFKKAHGGLWVGGTAYLTNNEMEFKPNALNKAFYKGDNSLHVPLEDILSAEDKFGLFTRIIHLTTKDTTLKLRCYGAKKFAAAIQSAIKAAKA